METLQNYYDQIDRLLESWQDEFLLRLQHWLTIPSVKSSPSPNAPFGKEIRRMLDTALSDAQKLGFQTRNFDGYCGDVLLGDGPEAMGIYAHLDVVSAGSGWSRNPWQGTIEDGRIYGRGAMDDKGAALCALYAMRAVRDAGVPLKDRVQLFFGCDEEHGSLCLSYYKEHTKVPQYGFTPDSDFPVINAEKGILYLQLNQIIDETTDCQFPVYAIHGGREPNIVPHLAHAELGVQDENAFRILVDQIMARHNFRLRVESAAENRVILTAEGISSHSSIPSQGLNAIGVLLATLDELQAGGAFRKTLSVLNQRLGLEYDGRALGIRCSDTESGMLTCNLGNLRYDGHSLSLVLDIRYPITARESELMAQFYTAFDKTGFSIEQVLHQPPLHVPADHPQVRALLNIYTKITGEPSSPRCIGGGTYARHLTNTVGFGILFPDEASSCHLPDENIRLQSLYTATRLYAHAIVAMASGIENDETPSGTSFPSENH